MMTEKRIKNDLTKCGPIEWPRALAVTIIINAAQDWRLRIRRKTWLLYQSEYDGFDDLRAFFRSDWCNLLAGNFCTRTLLEVLELELAEAKRQCMKKGKTAKPPVAGSDDSFEYTKKHWDEKELTKLAVAIKAGADYKSLVKLLKRNEQSIRRKVAMTYKTENLSAVSQMMSKRKWGSGAPESGKE